MMLQNTFKHNVAVAFNWMFRAIIPNNMAQNGMNVHVCVCVRP